MFSKHVGVCDSNMVEVLAILDALQCFKKDYFGVLLVESDSFNMVAWVSNWKANPWKFQFIFNEIRAFSANINVAFYNVLRSDNSLVDALVEQR